MIPIWLQIVFACGLGSMVVGFWAWTRAQIMSLTVRMAGVEATLKAINERCLERINVGVKVTEITTQIGKDVVEAKTLIVALTKQVDRLEARESQK